MTKLNWATKVCGAFLLWAAAAVALPAQSFATLYRFCSEGGECTDGEGPRAAVVQGTNGDFYGTTSAGGTTGSGTIFSITPSGTLTTLHSFDGTDGYESFAGLVQGTDGNFYGTASEGGANDKGTIFKITPSGVLTTLHSFAGTDGANPYAALVQGMNGDFYGTTGSGGVTSNNCPFGCGTVFTITPSGTLTTLHSFGLMDGEGPYGVLIQVANGDLYGTTAGGGGSGNCQLGCGTIFKIAPDGMLTILHSFDGTDGEYPYAGLVLSSDENFYGTAESGGANGAGTAFKVTPSGTLTTLYSFCSQADCADGAAPYAALVQGTDGNLYGTTDAGGANENSNCMEGGFDGCGSLFKISPSGVLTTLYSLCSQGGSNCTDGEYPVGGLVQGTDGGLYGTTIAGGAPRRGNSGDAGAIFSLSVYLGQFIETNPTSGKVGAAVRILGSFLTGATSVTFNGTSATFTVNSKFEITTTVPTGATTGTVQVVTPRSGTLSSNVPFRVAP
jgi:uncharacterized repeat protein (TIGR03803 family)